MDTIVIVLNGTTILCLLAVAVWLHVLGNQVARAARMQAEIEHQETIDRVLFETRDRPNLSASDIEQRVRVALNPMAIAVLTAAMGPAYTTWVTQTVLDRVENRG